MHRGGVDGGLGEQQRHHLAREVGVDEVAVVAVERKPGSTMMSMIVAPSNWPGSTTTVRQQPLDDEDICGGTALLARSSAWDSGRRPGGGTLSGSRRAPSRIRVRAFFEERVQRDDARGADVSAPDRPRSGTSPTTGQPGRPGRPQVRASLVERLPDDLRLRLVAGVDGSSHQRLSGSPSSSTSVIADRSEPREDATQLTCPGQGADRRHRAGSRRRRRRRRCGRSRPRTHLPSRCIVV